VIALFDRERVSAAVVSGGPGPTIEALHRAAPDRILPFLSVYESRADKRDWMRDLGLPARIRQELASGIYRGIGELHLFAQDRDSQVLAALVALAKAHDLVLQIHGDAAVIDAVFEQAPELTVLWAHLGTDPRPDAIAPMLARYPNLYADTSVRDGRFVDPDGCLRPEWRTFFVEQADQVLVGVDTHWPPRWKRFGEVTAEIRNWLAQLPPPVAERLAYRNAARLFGMTVH
jgi:predicted TIM-barrel fold metal-dependent hydrolase